MIAEQPLEPYHTFLETKRITAHPAGIEVALAEIHPKLFPFQRAVVQWALHKGRAALFADCGMGKSFMQLVWAQLVAAHSGGDVLILAPLAVASQTIAEGEKLGIAVQACRSQTDVRPGLTITNYEMLSHFDASHFVGVVCDESSILKSYMGKTKRALVEAFAQTPYRLCCTATPAPNDVMEIGNHSEFLGVMPSPEMLMRWFINDTMQNGHYRLKGHATRDFWHWVSTWAVSIRTPSDLGYPDDGFVLPELRLHRRYVETDITTGREEGQLFRAPKMSATNLHKEMRLTAADRAQAVADLVHAHPEETWVIWCNTNYEADELVKRLPEAIEVRGAESITDKERKLTAFTKGEARLIITKPSLAGYGLNWQHCHHTAFVGLSYSFEDFYQAVRRLYRFGQAHPVEVTIVSAETEAPLVAALEQKMHAQMNMRSAMQEGASRLSHDEDLHLQRHDAFEVTQGEGWQLYHGDCVTVASTLPDESIHFSIFSPPFSSLYIYSDALEDMGNAASDDEFFRHLDFLIPQLLRITKPGRLCAVHCKDLVSYKGRDGAAGIRDFSGEIVRHFSAAGWQYHSKVTIWKDPVIEMQRTKAHGLLYKQLRADSTFSRQGLPDYLLIFRKWARSEEDEAQIEPVTHTHEDFPLALWQRYASPVWFDIRQTRVLNVEQARESQDEKHICLARGSLVLTRDGYCPIEEVQVGELVLTHRGRWRTVTAKACTGIQPVVRVTAQGVADLRLTPDQQLWTRKGRTAHPRLKAKEAQPEWIAASETLGSYVNLKLPPIEASPLSAEEWWIVGRWLGDGHLSVRGLPHLSCSHQEMEGLVARLGVHAGCITRNATATQIYIKDRAGQVGGRIHDMIRRCGIGAANKRVPAEALALPPELAEALLDGYLSADGHQDRLGRWQATSVSRALVLGMALVAQRARGVVASVYAGRSGRQVTIQGRVVTTRDEWVMLLSPRHTSAFLQDDGAWKKVRSITPIEDAEVWDITVDEDASFVAEGCIVKNCPLQLDVIERALQLWSNPGETVFSPFAGIGSEGYEALRLGRTFIGIELKRSYLHAAQKNLERVLREKGQASLWEEEPHANESMWKEAIS